MTPPGSSEAVARRGTGRQAGIGFIMVTVLIDMLSIGLIVPVLPALVGEFTTDPAAQARWYGLLVLVFSVASFFSGPILGALSDRFGRRPVLLVGFCGLAVNFFVTAAASAMWMLIASRIIGGATQANAAVANAYVADITPPEQRARRFGLLGAMFGIGFILGPVAGGILGGIDLRLPFWAAGALSLLNLAYGIAVLPESLPPERRRSGGSRSMNPFASLVALGSLQGVGPLVGVLALTALAQFSLYTTWVLYTTYRFEWGPTMNGWSLFAVGVVAATVQGALMGRLLRYLSPQRLALLGIASTMLAYLGWGLATAGWVMFVVIVANVLGNAVMPALNSIVSGAASADAQGRTMGAVGGLNSLMAVFAPVVAAPLMAAVSHLPRGDWRVGLPMFFGAALSALALALAWWHFRRQAQRSAATITHPASA